MSQPSGGTGTSSGGSSSGSSGTGGTTSSGGSSGGTNQGSSGSSGGNAPDLYTENYSGFGRHLGADPGEGDNGFDRSNLPFGVRPTSPVNRDTNTYGTADQDPAYLGNPDAAQQADNITGVDIDGLEVPALQAQRAERYGQYADAQREAARKGDGSGVGTGG